MKYKIEKNTVQETLILPLYSRKLCTELYPNLYQDETAVHLIDQIDYDFSQAEKNSRSLMQRFGALEVAMRQNDLAFEVRVLWTAGCFWPDTSPASPVFWCDMLLTLTILGLLPAVRKAVDA